MSRLALTGADVFDGDVVQRGLAVLLNGDVFERLVPQAEIPSDVERIVVPSGVLTPGFVDLQVNGGGGVLFNADPSVDALRRMSEAHLSTGTRAFLPTLITDTPDTTKAAIEAVAQAITEDVPGVLGIHLEGPHLSVARKGAHDAELIRPMTGADEAVIREAAARLPNVIVTVAPENTTPHQVECLVNAGVVVSLGHSDCTTADAHLAFDAGARCATHLFNAMSPLGSREPGLVGAALAHGGVACGLIADGIHVHPDSLRIATAAKPDSAFLVTDAMATVGSDITEFRLNGRQVLRREGRLTLEDGTLAGADLTMPQAIRVMVERVGLRLEDALRMATSVPAGLLRRSGAFGRFTPGARWSGIHVDTNYRVSDPIRF